MNIERNRFEEVEWKMRSKYINPMVGKIQQYFGDYIRLFIQKEKKSRLSDLHEIMKGKKIAIVGNSPILEGSGFGEKIDNYDIVIRFNRGILDNQLDHKHTGVRTDIWSTGMLDTLTSKEVKTQIKNTKNSINMLIPFPFEKNKYRSTAFNIFILELLSPYKNHDKFYIDLDSYKKNCEEIGKEPSSGFSVIKYISEYVNVAEIGLFGFTFSSQNRICGDSYATQHDFEKEEKIIMETIDKNNYISIFK